MSALQYVQMNAYLPYTVSVKCDRYPMAISTAHQTEFSFVYFCLLLLLEEPSRKQHRNGVHGLQTVHRVLNRLWTPNHLLYYRQACLHSKSHKESTQPHCPLLYVWHLKKIKPNVTILFFALQFTRLSLNSSPHVEKSKRIWS